MMPRVSLICCLLALVWLAARPAVAQQRTAPAAQASPLTVEQIMQEPATWIGDWPENVRWGERGEHLYFDWNPQGQFEADSLYRVPRTGGEPEKVPPAERRAGTAFFDGWQHAAHAYDQDQNRKVYRHGGDLYLLDRRTGAARRLTKTRAAEADPRFALGGERVLFQRENNLFEVNLETGLVAQRTDLRAGEDPEEEAEQDSQQVFLDEQQQALFETLRTEKEEDEAEEAAEERDRQADDPPPTFYTGEKQVRQLRMDPQERFATFALAEEPEDDETTAVLDFVTETGYTETRTARPKVGSLRGAQTLYVQDLRRDTTVAVDLHQLPGAYEVPAYRKERGVELDSSEAKRDLYAYGPFWSPRGEHAMLEVRARDNKDRWIARLDAATGGLTVLDRQQDAAWIAGPGISWYGGPSDMGWLPASGSEDSERFYFQSEKTGYSHLYTVDAATGEIEQLTSGDFEVFGPRLSKDGRTWTFVSSEGSPHERHVYRMPVEGGERTRLTTMEGMIGGLALSPDGERLGLLHSQVTQPPEVYLQAATGDADAQRITDSPTDEWQAYDWRTGDIIRFTADDGAEVPAQVFRPDDSNGAAVLFVHGAGYLQNVHRGWSGYFREYMFHNLLADLGYTVMNVDYRASAGYGRDWRTAVYRHMGGRDLQDYVSAQQHLEDEYGIGPERTFIYGGSYGGFITLMALFTEPEHFGGGAALRSVTDWAHYNDPYTSNILNTPATDSLAYARSSPIYFAEGLDDPLLIAHGMVDENVQFQDVVRLAQRLIELGKEEWEMAVYPVEGHGFTEPTSWADEYRRILEMAEESVGLRREEDGSPALEGTGRR